jgi:hypothetical protein
MALFGCKNSTIRGPMRIWGCRPALGPTPANYPNDGEVSSPEIKRSDLEAKRLPPSGIKLRMRGSVLPHLSIYLSICLWLYGRFVGPWQIF